MIELNNQFSKVSSSSKEMSSARPVHIYVFGWLQGLSIIPDVAGIELQNNTAEEIDEQHDLFIDSEGGIISGSVGSLNKLIVPYSRTTSRTTSESSNLSRNFSTSTGSSNSSLNESIDTNKPTEFIDFDDLADIAESLLVSFKCPLSEEKEFEWKTLLINSTLYVDIPTSMLPEGSRESFISLLEFAEEKLECEKVFVCFKNNRPDRTALMRVFMFLGFSVVPPDNKSVPQNSDIMSMVYTI